MPGTKFRFVGKPTIGWGLDCEVGFTGIGGFVMSKLLARVRRTMMTDGIPSVLAAYHASRIA
ncbi:hypothetical protein EV645_3871 [Kribbella rubisoli]|uniref:Uncharacterized protein n=1 Tax=Kribbella rubisoli TaxID=3075929 RepID=A0A4Q7X0D6_9ACTN|nr:hypothetical protein [Kribbella rubisoli]RZU16317.1 hypothetical protein EV645_3871 [Kribbella rubisoli]